MSDTPNDDGSLPLPPDQPVAAVPQSAADVPQVEAKLPRPVRDGSRSSRVLSVLCGLLAVALVATSACSYLIISGINKTLDETRVAGDNDNARARERIDLLSTCVTSMKADEASLLKLNSDITAVGARAAEGGDLYVRRKAFEDLMAGAMLDFSQGLRLKDNKVLASGKAKVTSINTSLVPVINGLIKDYNTSLAAQIKNATDFATQMSQTASQCSLATGP